MKRQFKFNKTTISLLMGLAITSPLYAEDTTTNEDIATADNSSNSSDLDTKSNSSSLEKSASAASTESLDIIDTATKMNDEAAEWADDRRDDVKNQLGDWATTMDGWFGEPDPNDPASANLRIVIDSRWEDDPVDGSGWTVEPRIRGRLRLPVLEERLSLIIGDEELDEEAFLRQNSSRGVPSTSDDKKTYDREKTRDDNASIALRWSKIEETLGFDADIGVRSGDDLYVKFTVDKDLYEDDKVTVNNHNYYRYGTDSEHTLKGELNVEYFVKEDRFINNNTTIKYRNQDNDEETTWTNELRRINYLDGNRKLSYGISTYGFIDDDKPFLNTYGPSISYRQPFWREWLFLQTEVNYFNDKDEDKDHYPSALIRLEALF